MSLAYIDSADEKTLPLNMWLEVRMKEHTKIFLNTQLCFFARTTVIKFVLIERTWKKTTVEYWHHLFNFCLAMSALVYEYDY